MKINVPYWHCSECSNYYDNGEEEGCKIDCTPCIIHDFAKLNNK